ncbi:hypothetical protein [Streptosporangium lutulentum]|uniref:ATP-binding protein n=1 Tax=Streptosporangium lutulentum TaxID=1461250 RepID=A0ABT9Q4N0_9ACTN|nr:hypothetical protein [Streptosporangium lutulentum]MDP9841695.1 hypothetical protein [Streptosporangium lutulentum]
MAADGFVAPTAVELVGFHAVDEGVTPCIAIPRMKRAGRLDTSGRGLAIVQDLSHNWDWTLNAYGKAVWFQLVAWPALQADHLSLI